MVPAEALVHVDVDIQLLARPQLCDQDVRVEGSDLVLARKVILLFSYRGERDILSVNVRIVVQLFGIL